LSISKKFRVAIDMMGSDFAPLSELQGAADFAKKHKSAKDTEFFFIGDEEIINKHLPTFDFTGVKYSIVHADQVVSMDDDASVALKQKKNSSIAIGVQMQKEGKVDAFLSAGNTGAMLSTSTVLLGRIAGVSRPTIGTFFPSLNINPTLILDAGANVDSKAKFLYEFAVMGSLYFKEMFGVENPKVALLNIGEEASKGNELALETYKLLKDSNLNFIGNVEGRDIFVGKADVIVCDGFTGNILLKFAESIMGFFKATFRNYAKRSFFKKLRVGLFAPTLKDIFRDFDYQEHGGVPMLGVNGVIIIGHGSSSGLAVENMIKRSIEIISKDLNKKIENELKK
jgi:glycerol-3-phosphate acyltransferase PlsX